ncbi:heme exporter protein CcmD [Emcibacter sp. SYSU 3D8]|uniref:heme exporter protein CcmD n=1 Tax=Emcibacter sp. SYSU 3D8 TaxID=3133969 RepID=UPI0031FEB11D
MNWEYASYIWSAYAAAAVILPVVAAASALRLRRALRLQVVLEARLEEMRSRDEA